MGEKIKKEKPDNGSDLPLSITRQPKGPNHLVKVRHRRKTFDEGTGLAQLEENSKRYAIPEKIILLCTFIAKQQYAKYHFKRENLEWIQEQVLRIAILLTGCLQKQLVSDEAVDALNTPAQVFQLLKKALGIEQYQIMIESSSLKQKVLKLAQEHGNWAAISEFRYRVFVPATTEQPCLAYLDKYQSALRSLKYRVRLFEIVEMNVPEKDRIHFLGVKRVFGGDNKTLYYSLQAIISNLILLTYFKDRTGKKTIDHFIEIKDFFRNNFESFRLQFRDTLRGLITPESFADGILELPEVVASLHKLEDRAKNGGLYNFLLFFGTDPEIRNLSQRFNKVVVDIGRWSYVRKAQELPNVPIDFVSPSLARAANKEYVEFLDEYPWFAKFLSKLEIVRYLVAATNDEHKAVVLSYVNKDRLVQAEELLAKQITVDSFLKLFLASNEQSEPEEISELVAELSRKSPGRLSQDRHLRRAQLYIDHLLTKWSDNAIIDAVVDFALPDYVVQFFPLSYQYYLWYLYQFNLSGRNDWKPPFAYPAGMLEHITPADVARYIKYREDYKKTRDAKKEAEEGVSGKQQSDEVTIIEQPGSGDSSDDQEFVEVVSDDETLTVNPDLVREEEILDGKL